MRKTFSPFKCSGIVLAIFTIVCAFSLLVGTGLGISQQMAYEGNLYDSAGTPLTGSYNMRFSILKSADGSSSAIWGPETHAGVTVSKGWFSVLLGENIAIDPSTFTDSQLYLKIEIANPPSSSNYELLTPSTAIVSVGSAFKAIEAQTAITVSDGSITAAKLARGAVTKESISTSNTPANNQYLRWYDNSLQWATVSGGGSSAEADDLTIGTNASGSLEVKNLGISAAKISTSAVTAEKLASKSVTLESIDTGGISPVSGQFLRWSGTSLQWATVSGGGGSGTPDGISIGTNVSGSLEVLDAGISTAKIANNAVTAGKIGANAVTADAIATGAVSTSEIAGGAVTSDKLAAGLNITTTGSIAAASFAGTFYGNGAGITGITATNVADYSITTSKIATSAVTAEKIASNAITADAIAAGAVSTSEIAGGAVTSDKLAAGLNINTTGKITAESFYGSGIGLTGIIATTANYAAVAGTATTAATAATATTATTALTANYAALAGTATSAATANIANYAAIAGSATSAATATTANIANYAAVAGTATTAATATTATTALSANYAALAGTATSAATANIANYAAVAGTATTAASATTANIANYAAVAGTATTAATATTATTALSANYAALAGTATSAATANIANYAAVAGTATTAATATTATTALTANYAALAGTATSAATANIANYAAIAGSATSAATATTANIANYSSVAGTATTAATATTATTALSANYATLAGTATSAATANIANYAAIAGSATSAASATTANIANYAAVAGTATTAATATTATTALTANYAALAGTATSAATANIANYATVAGTATSAATATTAETAGSAGYATTAGSAAGVNDYSITTSKIATSAVTAEKIASNAVTADSIAAGAVTDSKILNITSAGKVSAEAVMPGVFGTGILGSKYTFYNNVGIGTNDANALLHVYSGVSGSYVRLQGSGDTYNYAGLQLWSTDKSWEILHTQSAGETNNFAIQEYDGSNYNKRLVIEPGGNVGIGTIDATSQLTVAGTIELKSGGIRYPDGTIQTSASQSGNIQTVEAGRGLSKTAAGNVTTLEVVTDNSTLTIESNALKIKPRGITSTEIATGAITKDAISTSNTASNDQYLHWYNGNLEWKAVTGGTGGSAEPDNITIGQNVNNSFEVMNSGISTAKIADSAVTAAKLAPSSVTNESLAAGTFSNITGVGTLDSLSVAGALRASAEVIYPQSSTNDITASGITAELLGKMLIRIQGSGGPVTVTNNPPIAAGQDGQTIILRGTSDTNLVTFTDSSGLSLSSKVSFTLGNGDTLMLFYDAAAGKWFELNRNDN